LVQKNIAVAESPWWVYIILASDNSYYTGITVDMARRWNEHLYSPKGAKFFRGRKPKQLVYLQACQNRSVASSREAAIKKLSRINKIKLLADPINQLKKALVQGLVLTD
jgi:putative endonuclease|tara:strand:- start:224 stop:550 length:327 start_codon:yes stop_codon:yes gene_type:complete